MAVPIAFAAASGGPGAAAASTSAPALPAPALRPPLRGRLRPELTSAAAAASTAALGAALAAAAAAFCAGALAGGARPPQPTKRWRRLRLVARCAGGDEGAGAAAGIGPGGEGITASAAAPAPAVVVDPEVIALREEVLVLAAASSRGQTDDGAVLQRCRRAIEDLERENPTPDPAASRLLEGQWRLIYASEDPTRCSPFFWALRKRMRGISDPNPLSRAFFGGDDLLENTLAFTDLVPIKTVGVATQRLERGELVNQVVVGVFPTGESKMTTTCSYSLDPTDPSVLTLTVQKTQVLGASLAASFIDQFSFPSGEFLGDSARVRMLVTYLDDRLRIVRDADRQAACFVFCRDS